MINNFVIAGIIGTQEIIIILLIVLVLFGAKKIPDLMKGVGKGIKEFKDATSDKPDTNDNAVDKNDK